MLDNIGKENITPKQLTHTEEAQFAAVQSVANNYDTTIFSELNNEKTTEDICPITIETHSIEDFAANESDAISLEYLSEITQNYTQKTNLTEEQYAQVLAIDQLNTAFENTYSQYTNQLDSEGAIDDVYNALKSITGLGITREMVEDEFKSHFNTTKILTAALNNDTQTCETTLKEEFIRKINTESNGNILLQLDTFIEYFEDENEAIEKFNYFLTISKRENDPDISIVKNENNELQVIVGGAEPIAISEIKDKENYGPLYYGYEIDENLIQDDGYYDTVKSTDFNKLYKFLTGVEFSPENLETYIQTLYLYSSANSGYLTALNIQQTLGKKNLEGTFEEFLKLNNNNTEYAIQEFNNYYDSILNSKDTQGIITNDIYSQGKINSIEAKINEEGEIEYKITIEPYKENPSLISSFSTYNEETGLYEVTYNPSQLIELYQNEEYDEYTKQNEIAVFFENTIFQINSDVENNNILTKRYENSFKETNGLTLEELYQNYQTQYSNTLGDSDLQNLLNDYINDMDTYADKLSAIVSLGSIGLSFACPIFGYGALAGAGLDNSIDAINMLTNEQKDDASGWLIETSTEIALIAIGIGIGQKANQFGKFTGEYLKTNTNLSQKAIEGISIGAEATADLALGIGADWITTGELNPLGNGLSALIDIVSGIRGYKALVASKEYDAYLAQQKAIDDIRLEREYSEKTLEKTITEFQKKGIEIDQDRLNAAREIIEGGEKDQILREFSHELAKELSSEDYTEETFKKLGELLGYTGEAQIELQGKNAYFSETDSGKISARAKSEISIYSKLRNKMLGLETDMPETLTDAKGLIGDGQGVRITINSSTLTPEKINGLEITGKTIATEEDAELFINYLQGKRINIDETTKTMFEEIKPTAVKELSEQQTQTFVDSLSRGIENGDIVLGEINNYSGENGIPYLTQSQVTQLQDSYAKWYQDTLTETLNGNTVYQVLTDEFGIQYLYDPIANAKFYREVKVKSSTIEESEGVKPNGYTAAQFNLVNQFHQNTELQFRGVELDRIAEYEHLLYDIIKDKKTVSSSLYDNTKDAVRTVYEFGENNKATINAFNQYYCDIFNVAREKELGITSETPNIKNYQILKEMLTPKELYTISLPAIIKLHKKAK